MTGTKRLKLLAMYDALCHEWYRAVELDESFLAHLMDLTLQELRERLGADVPMPRAPRSAAEDPRPNQRVRGRP